MGHQPLSDESCGLIIEVDSEPVPTIWPIAASSSNQTAYRPPPQRNSVPKLESLWIHVPVRTRKRCLFNAIDGCDIEPPRNVLQCSNTELR